MASLSVPIYLALKLPLPLNNKDVESTISPVVFVSVKLTEVSNVFYDTVASYVVSLVVINLPQTHFYKPKLTSVMLYGTTELWLSILRVNGLKNVTEYHLPFIRYYDPDGLKTIINIYFKRQDKTT